MDTWTRKAKGERVSSGPMSEEDLIWATKRKQGKAQIKVLRSLGYHPNVVDGKPVMTW